MLEVHEDGKSVVSSGSQGERWSATRAMASTARPLGDHGQAGCE